MGLTARDQALALLVEHVNSARLLLSEPEPDHPGGPDAAPVAGRTDLARAVVAAPRRPAASAMTRPAAPAHGGRHRRRTGAPDRTPWSPGCSPSPGLVAIPRCSVPAHRRRPLRCAWPRSWSSRWSSCRRAWPTAARSRNSNGGRRSHVRPSVRPSSWRSSTSHSPWLRNALRSALGLGLAVLVVHITGVEKGFWVLLGVISILRFDAVGTRRFAAAGGGRHHRRCRRRERPWSSPARRQQPWVLWVLLPGVVFLAAWSAVAISYPVGQAAFSGPRPHRHRHPRLAARSRHSDSSGSRTSLLGAAVALVVGLLMWPRGAVGYLRHQLVGSAARRQCLPVRGARRLRSRQPSDGTLDALRRLRQPLTAERAQETYDVVPDAARPRRGHAPVDQRDRR